MRDYDEQRVIAGALAAGSPGRAHLMGAGGVGVAGLATLLAARGWTVDGCDAAPNPLTARAQAAGLAVASAHAPAHLAPLVEARRAGLPVCVIRSTAIADDEPEIAAARAAGIPVLHRGVALAAWVSAAPHSVAVCGAHGKTTTSLFVTRLFLELGRAVEWCLGGESPALGVGAGRSGGSGVCSFVVEADESDGTLALYRPCVTVVTNIDVDHLEHFAGIEDLAACYRRVVDATRSGVAWCADNPLAAEVCGRACDGVHALSFGFSETAWLRATDADCGPERCAFTVSAGGRPIGRVTIGVPGRHNVLNALGALAAAVVSGVAPEAAAGRLAAACAELPNRRFETVAQVGGARVIVDYAHHPEEIRALMAQARGCAGGTITAVFQPHRYTRTLALRDAFPPAFDGADRVILMPVYAASEQPLAGGSAEDLYAAFRRLRPAMRVLFAETHDEAWHAARSGLAPDDVLLVVGAGDVVALAARARECASDAAQPPMAGAVAGVPLGRLTTFGVGGAADWFLGAADEAALARALAAAADRGMPVQVLGGGANTLVADGGVAGLVIRLSGPAFQAYRRVGDGEVEVGCGLAGAALLDRLEADGLAGLECLEGVPGQVGGWLAMNAGAHGGSVGERVVEIRCLNFDGTPAILSRERCGFGYRRCDGLRGRVALSVRFRLEADSPDAVRRRRDGFRLRRTALEGLRTAGSVFRNPEGDFAGRLLEAAGCQAMRVGGAAVFGGHANVIVAGAGSTASDVLALMRLMARAVDARWGVRLAPEVRLLR
jgi:UDP-N-acetylmuramate--L-alanine ligase/UDP-N-acetylenolpyruvoylglucosamine reductase